MFEYKLVFLSLKFYPTCVCEADMFKWLGYGMEPLTVSWEMYSCIIIRWFLQTSDSLFGANLKKNFEKQMGKLSQGLNMVDEGLFYDD